MKQLCSGFFRPMRLNFRFRRSFLELLLVSVLTGCVSTSTQMINDNGQVGNCSANGFGIIGSSAALIMKDNCVSKYKDAGYREIDDPVPLASSKLTTVNTQNETSTSPTTLKGKDGFLKITLPAGWVQATPPSPSFELYAKNPVSDTGLLISSVNSDDIEDWLSFAGSLRDKLAAKLTQSSSSEIQKIKVNDLDALRLEIGGVAKNGAKLHYLGTMIKADKKFVYLLSWSLESKFADKKVEFEQLASAIQF